MSKRILVCSEAHYLNTGYGVMYKQILDRLYRDGYEVAEHATYGRISHLKDHKIPWKFYPNEPEGDDPEHSNYKSNILYQFGLYRFDKVVLHFKPDIVFGCRDIWMDEHIVNAPLSKYYTSILAPPIDSTPQPVNYLASYNKADYLMPLSNWGVEVMKKEISKQNISLLGFGVDLDVFKPMDKVEIRKKWGLNPDAQIFGTVMRNQARKLYPALIKTFSRFLDENPSKRKNTYLYLHAAYPDKRGWNLSELITEYGIHSNVICTYCCSVCNHKFIRQWSDAKTTCNNCGSIAGFHPNVLVGLSREELAEVYNIMDFYIQYSEKEGGGFPIVEAAACGVYTCAPPYTAMKSAVENLDIFGLDYIVRRSFNDQSDICTPDDTHLLHLMESYKEDHHRNYLTESEYKKHIRKLAEKHYNWEDVYQRLKFVIDNSKPKNWNEPAKINQVPNDFVVPTNEHFLRYLQQEVDIYGTAIPQKRLLDIQRDLFYGYEVKQEPEIITDKTKKAIIEATHTRMLREFWCESVRQGKTELKQEPFLCL